MFNKPTQIALACALLCHFSPEVMAQVNSELAPVVISANRFEQTSAEVPAMVQIISAEEIQKSGATSVPEALSKIGNLNVRNLNGGQLGVGATVDMRGFGASAKDNTLILLDGQRLNPIDSGSVRWESIPIQSIERIEVIYGGGSVQYGDRAVGGVVNIITRTDSVRPATGSITLGSFGTAITNASYGAKSGNTKIDLDFNAASSDGWRDNSEASQGVIRSRVTQFLNATDRIFLEGQFNTQSFATPGGVLGQVGQGNPRAAKFNNIGDKTVTNGTGIISGFRKALTGQDAFEFELAYRDSGATQYTPNLTAKITTYDKWSLDFTPRYKKTWGTWGDSVIGFDYSEAMGSFITSARDNQKANLTNRSYYLTHRLPLSNQLDLLGGIRRQTQDAVAYDYKTSTDATNATKSQSANASDLALNYRYGDSLSNKVFARVNRSYRFANIDEFWGMGYGPAPNYSPYRIFSGILLPQKNQTLEIGGEWQLSSQQRIGITAYQLDTENEIRYDHATGTNINSADIRRVGVTAFTNIRLNPFWTVNPRLNVQRARYTAGQFDGKDVGLVPSLVGSIGVAYQPKSNLSYNAFLNYTGSQRYEGDESNSLNKMPSFTTVDLSANYKYRQWTSSLSVKNLFDKRYANYGGYGFVTLRPNVSDYSYYYYPADPRGIYISTRYTF